MNKLMMASLSVLLAGATMTPAFAQDGGRRAIGESSREGAGKGPAREAVREAREERQEAREDRRDERQETRQEVRQDRREDRQVVRTDPRGRAGDGDRRNEHSDVRNGRAEVRGDNRFEGGWAGREWQAQQHQRDNDRYRDTSRDRSRDYDRNRDYSRDYSRDRDGDRNRQARHDWGNDRHDWRQDQRRDGRYYTRYRDSRWSGYNWHPQYRYRAPVRYIYPYGYRPYRWQVGYQLPYNYYGANYYYVDYRAYRLPPPPYGYQWIRVDRDVVLVSIATGLIRDVLYGLFY